MGTTGGKGLTPAMGCRDLQDSGENISIGNQNDSCSGDDDESREKKQYDLIYIGVITCNVDKGWDITEKVIQPVFSTEMQTEGGTRLDYGVDASTDIGSSYQPNTDFLAHVHRVKERGANGGESIVCHDSEKKTFRCDKQGKEEKLGCTAIVRNFLFISQEVG